MIDIHPYLITDTEASGRKLAHLPSKDKNFDEKWLQILLFKHPSILPVHHLGDAFAPLVSIGREIGQIDDLFISPSGLLTIAETKLWRNPEGHRTVVAQILEYAGRLQNWTYSDLDKEVKKSLKRDTGQPTSIFEAVTKSGHNFDTNEIEFEARVQDCLTNGRFALLVVGDEIHPTATQLTETIQASPTMDYSMGFVELRCYRLEKDSAFPLVVVPNVIAKTKEYARTVVRVIYEEKKPEIHIDTIEPSARQTKSSPKLTGLSDFIATLPLNIRDIYQGYFDRWLAGENESEYRIDWGVGPSLKINRKGKFVTLFVAYYDGASTVRESDRIKLDIPLDIYDEYKDKLMQSPVFSSLIATKKQYVYYEKATAEDIALLLSCTDKLLNELCGIIKAKG